MVSAGTNNRWARNPMATTSLVLGLVALGYSWFPILNVLLFVPALLAIILGVIVIAKARRTHSRTGKAVAGIILGALAIPMIIFVDMNVGDRAHSPDSPITTCLQYEGRYLIL